MADIHYFTPEGLEKLRDEVQDMKKVQRPSISAQIAEARDKGDLSENAEYDAAKEAQGLLEAKIAEAESILANARVLDESLMDNSKVMILSKVKLKNLKNSAVITYTLVTQKEADMKSGRISVKSPIGSGLMGKKVGDVAKIEAPVGIVELEILEIAR